ncbi:hypothetical protein [Nocardioides sp.]|uniref:hypothetical protein n=1 Tax=Nocardioides sp. TaxID=35761 RepID=UPI002B2656E2|nr:hypothetical protein [Nocardioides sp.]
MSYGVMASKAAQVQVDQVKSADQVDPSVGQTVARTAAQARRRSRRDEPALWGSGRLTLTSLHLTFVPASGSSGVPALTLALADIIAIESGAGRGHKTIAFRTDDVVLRARLAGSTAFARQVATSVESNRKRSAVYPPLPETGEFRLSSG